MPGTSMTSFRVICADVRADVGHELAICFFDKTGLHLNRRISHVAQLQTSSEIWPAWVTQSPISHEDDVEYKFLIVRDTGGLHWECGPSRVLPASCSQQETSILAIFGTPGHQILSGYNTPRIQVSDRIQQLQNRDRNQSLLLRIANNLRWMDNVAEETPAQDHIGALELSSIRDDDDSSSASDTDIEEVEEDHGTYLRPVAMRGPASDSEDTDVECQFISPTASFESAVSTRTCMEMHDSIQIRLADRDNSTLSRTTLFSGDWRKEKELVHRLVVALFFTSIPKTLPVESQQAYYELDAGRSCTTSLKSNRSRSRSICCIAACSTVAGGSVGSVVGTVAGGASGALLGMLPALFTFGFSIPVGCVLGGSFGLGAGATSGSGVGLAMGVWIGRKVTEEPGLDLT